MIHQRSFLLLSMLAILTSLIALSLYFLSQTQLNTPIHKKTTRLNNEFYHANIAEYRPDGTKHYQLNSDHIKNYSDQISYLDHPVIVSYANDGSMWTTHADQGIHHENTQVIYLKGKVNMHRPKSSAHPETNITSSNMTIHLNTHRVNSKTYTQIDRPFGISSGIGLSGNYKKSIFKLWKQSKGTFRHVGKKQ